MKIHIITLCYNLFTEVQKATQRLYEQNERNFEHWLIDLNFPLIKDEIPENIQEAQEQNTESLKALAKRFGSKYLKFENIGISQNYSQFYNHIKPSDDDVVIGCDPDELQNENGWVNAMANALRGGLAYVAPSLVEHRDLLRTSPYAKLSTIGGEEVYTMSDNLNYGIVGFSGKFLNMMGGVPYPNQTPIYGNLEAVLNQLVNEHGLQWGLLKNYTTTHTDFEKGTPNTSSLLRNWKNYSVFSGEPQIQFEQWLVKTKNGEL